MTLYAFTSIDQKLLKSTTHQSKDKSGKSHLAYTIKKAYSHTRTHNIQNTCTHILLRSILVWLSHVRCECSQLDRWAESFRSLVTSSIVTSVRVLCTYPLPGSKWCYLVFSSMIIQATSLVHQQSDHAPFLLHQYQMRSVSPNTRQVVYFILWAFGKLCSNSFSSGETSYKMLQEAGWFYLLQKLVK